LIPFASPRSFRKDWEMNCMALRVQSSVQSASDWFYDREFPLLPVDRIFATRALSRTLLGYSGGSLTSFGAGISEMIDFREEIRRIRLGVGITLTHYLRSTWVCDEKISWSEMDSLIRRNLIRWTDSFHRVVVGSEANEVSVLIVPMQPRGDAKYRTCDEWIPSEACVYWGIGIGLWPVTEVCVRHIAISLSIGRDLRDERTAESIIELNQRMNVHCDQERERETEERKKW
jgi:hypothetical protein